MTLPSVPDFSLLIGIVAAALTVVSLGFLGGMAVQSRRGFGTGLRGAVAALRQGRLPARSFYAVLAAQFAVAAVILIVLDDVRYVENELGLGAYVSHNTTQFDRRLELTPVCGWRDLYPVGRMAAIIRGDDVPLRDPDFTLPDDPRIAEFNAFLSDLEGQFRRQAPDAILGLTERLNPVFAILSAFFLVVARSLFQSGDPKRGFAISATLRGAGLAVAFVMLGYFVILSYHASTEVAAGLAAGRVLCVSHVAPFFVAQTHALVTITAVLLVLFVLSPGAVFRKL